jgi:hypothetical protein
MASVHPFFLKKNFLNKIDCPSPPTYLMRPLGKRSKKDIVPVPRNGPRGKTLKTQNFAKRVGSGEAREDIAPIKHQRGTSSTILRSVKVIQGEPFMSPSPLPKVATSKEESSNSRSPTITVSVSRPPERI